VVREKEAVLRLDSRKIEPFTALGLDVSRPGWRVYLSVPLLAQGEIQGILSLFGEAPDAFDPNQVAFFKAVGQEVGIAIHNARLFEQVRASHERLQALSRRLVDVQEAERRHIARELHDEIGQALTGLKIALAMAARAPTANRGAVLDQAQELVDQLMTRARDLSLDLRPAMLDDLGLLPALLWHLERYTAQTGIRVAFEHAGLAGRFPPPVETAAYRIVQEALTNIARHAGVGEATVRFWADPHLLSLQIIDRGIGFDPKSASVADTTGGLSGMGERASLLAGQLRVESRPGAGTRVTAELPLAHSRGADGEGA
jgi:signal transduction histidine kinase